MITRNKGKYVFAVVLLVMLAAGLLGFLELEKLLNSGEELAISSAGAGATREEAVPVLLYHGIVEEYDGENIEVSNFREHMEALRECGYSCINAHELLSYYEDGTALPEKAVMITFDDGRKDSYKHADPILRELGLKATMFTVTSRQDAGDPFFLSWGELREMERSGVWDIEAHAHDGHDPIRIDADGNTGNFFSNKMWLGEKSRLETEEEYQNRLIGDLHTVKEKLERNLDGTSVVSFAFPLGDYGQKTSNLDAGAAVNTCLVAVKSIYPLSFELNWTGSDFNNFDDSDCSLLRRLEVPGNLSAADLTDLLTESREKQLPYNASWSRPEEMGNWFCNWGQAGVDDGSAVLASRGAGTGVEMILYGGHYWKDYVFRSELNIESGDILLIGRYTDDENFVYFGISGDSFVLGQKIRGENVVLDSRALDSTAGEYGIELEFSGNEATCTVNGQTFLGPVAVDGALARGSVGFQAYDSENGKARTSIRKVSIFNRDAGVEDAGATDELRVEEEPRSSPYLEPVFP